MKNYAFDYTVWRENSPEKFREACASIERALPHATSQTLTDVDGSTIRVFTVGEETVVVYDDYDVGAVFVLSDLDLSTVFNR